jgi:aminocarboxymuconate-semialdehyde decarboxylase
MIIDVHTHAVPPVRDPTAAERAAGRPYTTGEGGTRRVLARDTVLRELTPQAWDPSARLEEMDRLGVTAQAVMPAPFTFLYGCEPAMAAEFAAEQNEAIASFCAAAPARLIGFASVPLQDPQRAVAELRRSVRALGLRGAEIGTNAVTLQLHDAELDPFFAAAEELEAPLFIHPGPFRAADSVLHSGLAFALARPVETELAAGSLVFGGVLERHPRIRICLAHGGGGVPAIAGRWEAGWAKRTPGVRPDSVSPRALLRRLWADTLTYDPRVLPLTERTFGAGHLMVGTDTPFAVREDPPGAAVAEAARNRLFADPDLGTEAMAGNARGFLGMTVPAARTAVPTPPLRSESRQ